MSAKEYFEKFYIFSLFIIFFNYSLPKFNAEEIKWEKIEDEEGIFKSKKIKWEKYYPEPVFEELDRDYLENNFDEKSEENELKSIKKIFQKKSEVVDKKINTKEFYFLGFAVPIADVMSKKDFMIYAEQIFPFQKGYLEEGTANQNYSVFLSYGLNDNLMLMSFFSHSDDPLYSKIYNVEKQPANKWVSLGFGSRLNIYKNNRFLTSLDTSVEGWYVKSGGCNGIGCVTNSSNIFDKSLNEYKNLNLIGSIALPTTFKITPKTNLVLTPKITFLPEKQINDSNSGSFYGLNSGLGLGFYHEFNKRFHIYNSAYIPLSGENYFDSSLIFKRRIVYDFGFSYLLDQKTSFQGFLTNSFGATPATGILTIPSDDNLIIGSRLIYKPTSSDFDEQITNFEYKFEGLSVTNTEIIQPNQFLFDTSVDNNGGIWSTINIGLSKNFNFEISTGKSNNSSNITNKFFDEYIGLNLQNLRFGGKAILINQSEYSPITSGIRMTFGRTIGDSWPGYLFIENINSRKLSNRIKLNVTPKIAWTSSGNLAALGTSLKIDLNKYFSIILEGNTALENAESNFTSALRISKNKNRYFDLYLTNAVNFSDIGEFINNKEVSYGFKIGFKF